MSARKAKRKKKPAAVFPPVMPLVRLLSGRGRGVVLVLLTVAGFFWLWHAAWQEVGEDLLLSEQYWVTQEQVEITPPAEWIHDDVRAKAFQDASLDGPLSLMDEDLVPRVADAFSMHPWVARVRRVTKHYPARVRVELDYRRPVLMVQVPGGLFPVDVEGVLLPTGDNFTPLEAQRDYARLVGIDTVPMAPVGMRWGDARVLESAEIAATFGAAWQKLNLDRIVPSTMVEVGVGGDYTYELLTKGGTRIRWGRAPGAELAENGEMPAVEKVAWLVEYQRENSTLEGREGPQVLDLGATRSASRSAGKPQEALH
jgi:hypothetical protein